MQSLFGLLACKLTAVNAVLITRLMMAWWNGKVHFKVYLTDHFVLQVKSESHFTVLQV